MSDLRKPIVVLHESFRKFVEKFNVLSNNVGDPLFLKTHNDSDVVTTINEINATFQAYDGKIIYPNDSVPTGAAFSGYDGNGDLTDYPSYTGAQLPSTHLVISTNQHGGQDIDIDAGRDFLVNTQDDILLTALANVGITSQTGNIDITATLGDITLDASGKDIDFTDGSTTRFAWNVGADNTLDVTGNLKETTSGNYEYEISGTSHDSVGGVKTITTNDMYIVNTGGTFQQNTTGDTIFNTSGDITLDADGNNFYFKNGDGGDTQTHTFYDTGNYHIQTPANYTIEALGTGTITLDASGEDIVMQGGIIDGAGPTRPSVTHNIATGTGEAGQYTITAPSDVTIDAVGDIILDAAGNNITFKDDGATRQEYTLGATTTIATTGNRTETVTGNVSDSAAGTYHIGATGNFDLVTQGTHTVNTNSHLSQYVQGDVTLYNTGQFDIDAGGDIYLDAGDSDIYFQRNNLTYARWQMGIGGQPNALQLSVPRGNFQIDAANDIVLDAGDSDIIFKRDGTTFARWQMGIDGYPTYTRQSYPYGSLGLQAASNVTIDAGLDIILEANGGDVFMKDGATEYLRFAHAGEGNGRIDNNGIPVITFEDSDAVFNNDVNIEGDLDVDLTLNVDGDTTLNGNVTLGNETGDDITFSGYVASNIIPKTTNAYNLGSSTKEFKNGFFDGTVFADNLDGDSGTIANFNINTNTISNSTAGLIVDVDGDIVLDPHGRDIKFRVDDSDRMTFTLGTTAQSSLSQNVIKKNLLLNVDKQIYLDAGEGAINLRDSANQSRVQFDFSNALSTGTEMNVYGGSLTLDVAGDIVLNADSGNVLLKDAGQQFGRFENTSGNLIVRSGDTTAMTFSGANVTMAGQITLPSADLDTTAKTVHGAINEVDSDLGERTSLSSFYDGHKEDIVTALNRVAARVINVYDANGNLLNP